MFESKEYPKKKVVATRVDMGAQKRAIIPTPLPIGTRKNYYDTAPDVSTVYEECCFLQLQNDFPWFPVPLIREALRTFRNHYAPSKRYLMEMLADGANPHAATPPATKAKLKLLKAPRSSPFVSSSARLTDSLTHSLTLAFPPLRRSTQATPRSSRP
jgi:hypothetical protein